MACLIVISLFFYMMKTSYRRLKKVDKFISAGLPSKDDDPIGFEAVRSHMIHGPCGAYASDSSCMNKGE
ncbi:hypothetical protein Tco_0055679, partial [Tanacetum coccineum]